MSNKKKTKTVLKVAVSTSKVASGHKSAPKLSRENDPHLAREAEQYESPIPSREHIISVLAQAGAPVKPQDVAGLLGIKEIELDGFARRIGAMVRDGQILSNKKGEVTIAQETKLVVGRVIGHADGFGFLTPDDESADFFLNNKEMSKVLDGDRVNAREVGVDKKGRREAVIIDVISRANSKLVGRLFVERGTMFVVAENKRISQDILVEAGFSKGAVAGQVVTVELVAQPTKNSEAVARVIEVLGNYADPGMEIEIALRKHDLPHEWPPAVEAAEKKVPKKVTSKDIEGRDDLRQYPFVTIDGETARDFDDAVYCEKQGKGLRLMVAIADVSHYVKPSDALDVEALNRGNSVYFPRRVIPMLPESLSNEMCSLKPQVDRLVMVCDMALDAQGKIKKYSFFEGVIHSAARLTYNNVAKVLYSNEDDHGIDAKLVPNLQILDTAFQLLLEARHKRGAIDFESTETMMLFNEDSKIENIVPVTRNDAHRLIEECMLAANVCTAEYLLGAEHPNLYRIHEGPTPEKLESLRNMLKDFSLQLSGGDEPQAADYAALITKIKGRPDAALLQTVLLRSLRQAVYSPDNKGHFGLSYDAYAHFTSPIRRYPDLLTHRAIKAVLKGEAYVPKESWKDLGIHCSMTERRADDATRDVTAWLKCFYMKDRLGETFAGTIASVTSFGLFVSLDEVFVEGLVHISELGTDYFQYDKDKHVIVGERTRQRYQLADRVFVKVARVDIETAKIEFVLSSAKYLTPRAAVQGLRIDELEALEATKLEATKKAKPSIEKIVKDALKPPKTGNLGEFNKKDLKPQAVKASPVEAHAPVVSAKPSAASHTKPPPPPTNTTSKKPSANVAVTPPRVAIVVPPAPGALGRDVTIVRFTSANPPITPMAGLGIRSQPLEIAHEMAAEKLGSRRNDANSQSPLSNLRNLVEQSERSERDGGKFNAKIGGKNYTTNNKKSKR